MVKFPIWTPFKWILGILFKLMGFFDDIFRQKLSLLPTGRAFWTFPREIRNVFLRVMAKEDKRLVDDAETVKAGVVPEHNDFNTTHAKAWERALKLPISPNLTLSQRKAVIARKLNHPGDILGRGSSPYLNWTVQQAGFGVNLYRNRFDGEAKFPDEMVGNQYWDDTEYGEAQYGGYGVELIANHLEPKRDINDHFPNGLSDMYAIGRKAMRAVIYIADDLQFDNSGNAYAQIPLNRRTEFRNLILTVKPSRSIALCFVEYTGGQPDPATFITYGN